MPDRLLSTAAFSAAWLAAYGGALLEADHRLSLTPWLVALIAAGAHLVLEARRSPATAPPWSRIAYAVAWLGWLPPMVALRPLWPLLGASVLATIGLALARPPAGSPLPHGDGSTPPAVATEGGHLRLGVALAMAAALVLAAAAGHGGTTAVSTGAALLAASALIERPYGWRRRALLTITALACVLTLALALLLAFAMTEAREGRWRALAVALVGAAVLALIGRSPALSRRSLPHRAAGWLAAVAGLSTGVVFAASPRSPLSLVDLAVLRDVQTPPVWLALLLVVLDLLAAAVLIGARSTRDGPAIAARLALRRPPALVWVGCVVAGVALTASMAAVEGFEAALGPPPRNMDAIRGLLGPMGWGAVVGLVAAAIWEEVLFRGVLQPRIGLAASTAAFAAVHALQYGAFDVWWTLVLGLLLGLVARRWGTIAAATLHASFNLAAALGGP